MIVEKMANGTSKTGRKKIVLSNDQQRIFDKLLEFIDSKTQKVFILCGYAGTGKTTMMRHLIEELSRRNEAFSLHASTGRAAKILSNATGVEASTVHSLLYKFSDFNQNLDELSQKSGSEKDGQLLLNFKISSVDRDDDDTMFYIIDEASMISDVKDNNPIQATFGSGKLLSDLLRYDPNGKFIFVGDVAQLPPIQSTFSPALSPSYIREHFDIEVAYGELTQIMRQSKDNDLIKSANKVRRLYSNPPNVTWGKFPLRSYSHIKIRPSQIDLLNSYIDDIKKNGFGNSTMIVRSNSLCSLVSKTIRPALGLTGDSICEGDLLMITQNNLLSGLMNGDMVKVVQLGRRERRAGLTFRVIEVEELFTQEHYTQLIIEDIVYSQQTNLVQIQQKELFLDYYYRMKEKGIKQSSQEFKKNMFKDQYLNALRAVYGYVLTCHKAQGGEWRHVYLDIPRKASHTPDASTYQWLYTAMTRASDILYVADDFYLE